MENKIIEKIPNEICRTCMNITNRNTSLFDYVELQNQKLQLKFILLACTSLEVLIHLLY